MDIKRHIEPRVIAAIGRTPAVALLGPRQVGKTTLAQAIAADRPSIYLDLESRADLARLADPEAYLADNADKLIVLDEIQRVPDLFMTLRGIIDEGRRKARANGRFLILGSASPELLRQSAETLAGRISYLEMVPFTPLEVGHTRVRRERLWLRGGFPRSFLAADDEESLAWRLDFIRTYLERDIPQLGPRVPAETLRRFWSMLAHEQGQLLNAARLASSLGISGQTIARYLDLMVDLLLVRRLPPWSSNAGKRLVRSPKVYVRDAGLVHALLGLESIDQLLGHPVAGPSWEGVVIEALLAAAPRNAEGYFYRTLAGAEVDLLLKHPRGGLLAFEIKRSLAPSVGKGFHIACNDLKPDRAFVVYPGLERFKLGKDVEAIGIDEAIAAAASLK